MFPIKMAICIHLRYQNHHHPAVSAPGTGAAAWAPAPATSPRTEILRRAAGPASAPPGTSWRCSDGFPKGAAYLESHSGDVGNLWGFAASNHPKIEV